MKSGFTLPHFFSVHNPANNAPNLGITGTAITHGTGGYGDELRPQARLHAPAG